MSDPKNLIIPGVLASLLASVCGFHSDDCQHCMEGYTYRRLRGWSDKDIYDDALLYRDHREEWHDRTIERVKRTGHAVDPRGDSLPERVT